MSLSDVIKSHINSTLNNLYTTLPAKVIAVKKVENSTVVDVQPLINKMYSDGNVDKEPPLQDVIMKWPSGGGCFITFPIAVGDIVDLNFSMRNAVSFKNSEGKDPVSPDTHRKHDMNDVFATPCLSTYSTGIEVDPDAVEISSGTVEIRITKAGGIEFGEGAVEKLVLGDAFMALYNAHTHPTGVGPSGPPVAPMNAAAHLSEMVTTK
jgi:hypothetical protein